MGELENMPARNFLFGALFVATNRMETMLERGLKEFGVTAKQWFLSVVLDHMFDAPPTIKDTARAMGSSHQNVKQLAVMLQKKGLLNIVRDPLDNRAMRLALTQESRALWEKVRAKGSVFQSDLFQGIDEKELMSARNVLEKMLDNLDTIERDGRGESK